MKHTYSRYKKLYVFAFIPLLTSAMAYGMEGAETPPTMPPPAEPAYQKNFRTFVITAQARNPATHLNSVFYPIPSRPDASKVCLCYNTNSSVPKKYAVFLILAQIHATIATIVVLVKAFKPEAVDIDTDYTDDYFASYLCVSYVIQIGSTIPYWIDMCRECKASTQETIRWRDTVIRREEIIAAIQAQDVASFLSHTNDTATADPSTTLYNDETSILELAIRKYKEGMDPDARIVADLFNRWRAYNPHMDQTTIATILGTPEADTDSQDAYLIRLIAQNRNLNKKILDPLLHPHKRRSNRRRATFPVPINSKEEEEKGEAIPLLDLEQV